MQINYTDREIYSYAILLLFGMILLWKVGEKLFLSSSKRFLRRYRTIKKLKKLTWDEFEHLCRILFEEEGWKVRENVQKGADGGVDLWMKKRGKEAIVQCKKYEDAKVTIKVIREMYGLMHEYGVDKVFVITTSEFTKECYRFSEEKEIELINGKMLTAQIDRIVR
jgi:restriction system protein